MEEQKLISVGTGIKLTKRQKEKIIKKQEFEEREKIRRLNNIDKKVIIKVEYGLDSKNQKDFFISDNRRDVGVESYMGGVHSSAFKEKPFEQAEQEALDWLIKDILDDGIIRENISIIKEGGETKCAPTGVMDLLK